MRNRNGITRLVKLFREDEVEENDNQGETF